MKKNRNRKNSFNAEPCFAQLGPSEQVEPSLKHIAQVSLLISTNFLVPYAAAKLKSSKFQKMKKKSYLISSDIRNFIS